MYLLGVSMTSSPFGGYEVGKTIFLSIFASSEHLDITSYRRNNQIMLKLAQYIGLIP